LQLSPTTVVVYGATVIVAIIAASTSVYLSWKDPAPRDSANRHVFRRYYLAKGATIILGVAAYLAIHAIYPDLWSDAGIMPFASVVVCFAATYWMATVVSLAIITSRQQDDGTPK
jgi:hypothetical protein